MKTYKIAVSCGEKSGDLNTGCLIRKLNEKYKNLEFWGIGGKYMKEAGCNIITETDTFGSIGIVESVKVSFRLLSVYYKLKHKIIKEKPDILLCVDFGFFNTKLIKAAAKYGIRNIYYFPPGSWRKTLKHANALVQSESKVITPFPWSEKTYTSFGLETKFAGHPILELAKPTETKEIFFKENNIKEESIVLGFLPGSRKFEINMHIKVYAETIEKLYSENRNYIFLISANEKNRESISEKIKEYAKNAYQNVRVVTGSAYNIMAYSEFLFCCSGTATLEASVIGTPMVILYKGNPIMKCEYFFRKRRLPTVIGMPNIILDRLSVPELISDNVSPLNLIKAYKETIKRKDEIKKDFAEIKNMLGTEPVIDKIAETFANMANLKQ